MGTHRKNDSLTRKFIKNHHMVVTSLVKHILPPLSSRNIQNLLNPPPPQSPYLPLSPSQGRHLLKKSTSKQNLRKEEIFICMYKNLTGKQKTAETSLLAQRFRIKNKYFSPFRSIFLFEMHDYTESLRISHKYQTETEIFYF